MFERVIELLFGKNDKQETINHNEKIMLLQTPLIHEMLKDTKDLIEFCKFAGIERVEYIYKRGKNFGGYTTFFMKDGSKLEAPIDPQQQWNFAILEFDIKDTINVTAAIWPPKTYHIDIFNSSVGKQKVQDLVHKMVLFSAARTQKLDVLLSNFKRHKENMET